MKCKPIQESRKMRKKGRLLIEPSLAEEQQACNSSRTLSSLSSNDHQPYHESELDMQHENVASRKSYQRRQLSSLLVILFGASFLALACHSSVVLSQGDNSTAPSNQLFETTTTELPLTSLAATVTSTTTTVTDKPEIDGPEESETTTENGAQPATEPESEPEEEVVKTEQPISKLVDSVGGEAADLLVKYIKKDPEEEDLESDIKAVSGNSTEEQLRFAMETYARWRSTGDDVIELFSRKILPTLIEHGYEVDTSTIGGLLQVFNGIRALKPWALKILDASAKISPGILVGTQADFGDYDECLNVRSDDPSGLATPDQEVAIDASTGLPTSTLVGRYCVADVEFPKPPRKLLPERNHQLNTDFAPIELRGPLFNFSESPDYKDTIFVETANFFHMLYVDPLRVGICLTNKIDPANFEQLFNKVFEYFRVKISFQNRCLTKYDKPVWSVQQKISAWVLVVACGLVLLSTLLDLLHIKLSKLPLPSACIKHQQHLSSSPTLNRYRPLFTSYSILRNTQRLFRAQPCTNRHQSSPATHQSTDTSIASCCSTSSASSESSPSSKRRHSSLAGSDLNLIRGQVAVGKLNLSSRLAPDLLSAHKQQAPHEEEGPGSLSTQTQPLEHRNNLACLHGVRVITMIWMIINHTYLFGGFFVLWAYRRLIDISEWPKSLSFQLVLNGWLTVETYFLLSALIIVLNVLPLLKANKFSYSSYILHRLIRLLPAYLGLVCLNFLWPLISGGPVWMVKGRSFIQTPCENYLWTNFLFINNWIWPEKQCMVHTWFLSADFQLYLVAPIIVYLLYRRPVLGHLLNVIVAIVASVVSGLVIYANKLMPSTLINRLEFDSIKQQLSYSYFATYQHMGPYCLGIFIGYLLYNRPRVQLPKHITWMLWLLLPPLSFTTLLLTYLWNGAYSEPSLINPSPLVSAVYVAIHRVIWTSLVAWTVFSCSSGRANLLSNFLSHSMFVPLSRLSFSIYLVHFPIIMFRALNLRHTIEWTDTNILWEACGNFIFSVIVGYFVNIAFESPIINLEQFLFRRAGTTRSQDMSKHSYGDKFGSAKEDTVASAASEAHQMGGSPSSSQLSGNKTSTSGSENDSDDGKSFRFQDTKDATSDVSDEQVMEKSNAPIEGTSSHLSDKNTAVRGNQVLARWAKQTDKLRNDLMDYRRSVEVANQRKFMSYQELEPDQYLAQQAPPSERQLTQQNINSRYSTFHQNQDVISAPKQTNLHLIHNDPMVDSSASLRDTTSNRPSRYMTLNRINTQSSSQTTVNNQLYLNQGRSGDMQHPLAVAQSDSRGSMMSRKRISLAYRRQGRYNTLTGIGADEWRKQVAEEEDRWRMGNNTDLLQQQNSNLSWQAGAMIPRIQSSTLKRQTTRNATTSIAEETVFEERSE